VLRLQKIAQKLLTYDSLEAILLFMDVRFYITDAGQQPALDYLRSLDEKQRLLVGGKIRAIQTTDIKQSGVDVAPIEGKLWELRVGFHRVFYTLTPGPQGAIMWLLHAAQKDTNKTPEQDKTAARKRLNDLLALLARR
jgi:phage-related protein